MGREIIPIEEIRERALATMRAVDDSQVSVDVDHAKHLTCASSAPLFPRTVAKVSSLSRPLSDPSSVDADESSAISSVLVACNVHVEPA